MRQYSTYMPNEMGREIMNFYVRNGEYPGRLPAPKSNSKCRRANCLELRTAVPE